MRGVYSVEQIRAAEDARMARLPEGALMARASYGLSVECAAAAADLPWHAIEWWSAGWPPAW